MTNSHHLTLILGIGALILASGCGKDRKASEAETVTTVNAEYSRVTSHVLVREIKIPVEGQLDYAAYAKNIVLRNPDWNSVAIPRIISPEDVSFDSFVLETRSGVDALGLSDAEKSKPLAWTPALERLLKWNFTQTIPLASAYAKVTAEKWGDTTEQRQPYQEFATLFLHQTAQGIEAWAELEFKPGMSGFLKGIDDDDRDHYPEAYVKLNPEIFTQDMAQELAGDYSTKPLTQSEVMDWGQNLSSRWYPSYNTDMVAMQANAWPYAETPQVVQDELKGKSWNNALFILRSRPYEDTLFQVFIVDGMKFSGTASKPDAVAADIPKEIDAQLWDHLDSLNAGIEDQLERYGKGDWKTWLGKVQPFRKEVARFATAEPAEIQGLAGANGFLIFRRELDYLLAGDAEELPVAKNPLPVIQAFKDSLAGLGVDFLFVAIPTKLDIYPEAITSKASSLPGHVAQPYLQKFRSDLAGVGVESLDLLSPFLEAKVKEEETLYQKQDTHWNSRGLELAAREIAARVRRYPWFAAMKKDSVKFTVHDTVFESLGDIQARLKDADKSRFGPEKLVGRQIRLADGSFYQDDDKSPILVLGDSYTGVYQTVGCRHAGVTAHLAKEIRHPVDLIMGWGGGPEAPGKLQKRGEGYLGPKRLVIWMMSARDLFAYPGNWAQE